MIGALWTLARNAGRAMVNAAVCPWPPTTAKGGRPAPLFTPEPVASRPLRAHPSTPAPATYAGSRTAEKVQTEIPGTADAVRDLLDGMVTVLHHEALAASDPVVESVLCFLVDATLDAREELRGVDE